MEFRDGRYRLLAGEPARDGHGVWATVAGEAASAPYSGAQQEAYERSAATAFLTAPFVRLIGERGRRRIVVGQVYVAVGAGEETAVSLALPAAWSEIGGWHQEPDPPGHADDALLATLSEPAHPVPEDARSAAATIAKALAEASHNEVYRLRGLRYEMERQIADLLAHRRNTALRPLLAELVELSIAIGRARDQAREAIREGLWVWLWDPDTYHRNRTEPRPSPDAPTWASQHRAAVRHCEALDEQLAEEAARLHDLLSSMSTFAVAQDGEAQQRFNLIAAVAAAGLGLPALILSLYGADSVLPLDSFDHAWRALLPIAVATLVAAVVALRRMPGRAARPRHYALAGMLVAALVTMLLLAGALAPGR
ncbi:hypothetical protein [Gandjariella thermophila]|uniref:Magnesium transporter n=1 Tax=Gandjariella thermophila TaxID=1931992 RepID=A0A4D4J437_9PSEU|nr:hypothetical protein [Gandjariella thermophila]GDY29389.1 hypothetical protein GTS_10220 [Gandjariella thermophila]